MDYLLSFSRNPTTASLVRTLGLKVSLPPVLRRSKQPRGQRLLNDVQVAVGAIGTNAVTRVVGDNLAAVGARVVWTGDTDSLALFLPAAEAWAEPVVHAPLVQRGADPDKALSLPRVHALVFDATGIRTALDLDVLYAFFNTWLNQLTSGGRVVVLAHPADKVPQVVDTAQVRAGNVNDVTPWDAALERAAVAALWQGLEGFVRSVGKEIGRKGSTANLIWVEPGAEARVAGPLRFFLSAYSAFITSQPVRVSNAVADGSTQGRFERPLLGKVALVTGAARGIGRATAQALANEGARIALVEHPAAATEASVVARELEAAHLCLDIAEAGAPARIGQWLKDTFGGVDIVVHNAGITRDKTLARMNAEAWNAVLNVNLNAALALTHELLSGELLRNDGRIVSLASVGGIAGNVGQTNYAFSKAGIIGWTKQLSGPLAARGITINAVAPGFIETQMTAKMPTMIREAARRLSSLNQGGLPDDVAQAVTFFALPDSVGLTGNVLRVCGGALIGA